MPLVAAGCGDDSVATSDTEAGSSSSGIGDGGPTTEVDPDTGDASGDPPTSSTTGGVDVTSSGMGSTAADSTGSTTGSTEDGSSSSVGSSDTTGTTGGVEAQCGDGVIDALETCDDGNELEGDSCSADCQVASCLVPITHPTIQAGLDDGCHELRVMAGTYTEELIVAGSKVPQLIEGVGAGTVVISGNDAFRPIFSILSTLTLRNLEVAHGLTQGRGGGILAGNLTLDHVILRDNRIDAGNEDGIAGGGGVFSSGGLVILDSEVRDNSVVGEHASGGGVEVGEGDLFLANTLVANNSVSLSNGIAGAQGRGGGVRAVYSAVIIGFGSEIRDNTVTAGTGAGAVIGGGLDVQTISLEIYDSVISGNSILPADGPTIARGGGVNFEGGDVFLSGAVLSQNSATSNANARGGGLSVLDASGPVVIERSAFLSNSADGPERVVGGGLAVGAESEPVVELTLSDSEISDNQADGGAARGGGLYSGASETVTLEVIGTTFGENEANGTSTANGGGFYFDVTSADIAVHLSNSTLSGNVAAGAQTGTGGAFDLNIGALTTVRINSTTIANNRAITDDPADARGGGMSIFGMAFGSVHLENSVLWNNMAESLNDCHITGPSIGSNGYSMFGSEGSCALGFMQATDTFGVDPGLAELADNGGPTRTHAIGEDSPARVGPTLCYDENGLLVDDQRGSSRIVPCDRGAFEYQP